MLSSNHGQNIKMAEGPYGVPDIMTSGLQATKESLSYSHPLEASEKNVRLSMNYTVFQTDFILKLYLLLQYLQNKQNVTYNLLRNVQGLHAPLKLSMELKAVNKVNLIFSHFILLTMFTNYFILGWTTSILGKLKCIKGFSHRC